MDTNQLVAALAAAADAMRRSDPVWCAVMGVEQTTDVQWDDALAAVEDALDAARQEA
jgi:hypothetical protein